MPAYIPHSAGAGKGVVYRTLTAFVELTPAVRPAHPEVLVLTWNGSARLEIPASLEIEALRTIFAAAVRT